MFKAFRTNKLLTKLQLLASILCIAVSLFQLPPLVFDAASKLSSVTFLEQQAPESIRLNERHRSVSG